MPLRRSPNQRPRVLVTGTGGPSGVAVMKALGDDPLDIYSADIDPFAVGLYLVDAARRLIVPRGDSDDYTDFLLAYCEQQAIDVLIPTVDSELVPLARQREALAESGTQLVLASEQTLNACLDKWTLVQLCQGTVRVPATTLADEAFDPSTQALPVIVKPRHGSGSRGVRLIERIEDLAQIDRDGSLIVQEHLPGMEYSLDVLARRDGQVISVVPRARLKIDSGIAVTGKTVPDETLQATGRGVAERIGLTSVANVQVKQAADGTPALLEVNPRFPGTMSLTVASGVNMPKLCVDDALGFEMPTSVLPFEELAMVRYLEERFLAVSEIEQMEQRRLALERAPAAGASDG